MAFTPARTTKVVTRHEFFVPDGSTVRDLSDAMRHVMGQIETVGHSADSDDAFFVKSWDEGIVLYFETERTER